MFGGAIRLDAAASKDAILREVDKDAEKADGASQTQDEQLKDIENDTPATENVTVTEQTFNPC